jgi:hypothetical protein
MSGVEDAHPEEPQSGQDEPVSLFLSAQQKECHKEHGERFNGFHGRVKGLVFKSLLWLQNKPECDCKGGDGYGIDYKPFTLHDRSASWTRLEISRWWDGTDETILIVSPNLRTYIGANKGLLPPPAINPNLIHGRNTP